MSPASAQGHDLGNPEDRDKGATVTSEPVIFEVSA